MKYGQICWVDFPDRGGREQRGRRPAVIWQDLEAFPNTPTVLTIPLTSRRNALRFPGTLLIQPSRHNRLTAPSVALVFQLGPCDLRRIGAKVGNLDEADLTKLQEMAAKLQKLRH